MAASAELIAERMLRYSKLLDISILQDKNGSTPEHAMYMMTRVIDENMDIEKANRWVGFAQGVLVAENYLTLEEAKGMNR